MRNLRIGIIIFLFTTLIAIQNNENVLTNTQSVPPQTLNTPLKVTQEEVFRVDTLITAPTGYSLPEYTPIIINLNIIAREFPSTIDVFGKNTPDSSDDLKWEAIRVIFNGSEITSQVDDLDNQIGYSADDELIFQIPASVELASEETANFSLIIGTQAANLPVPIYEQECNVYEYPELDQVNAIFPDMLGEVYNIENGIIRASPLIDAAWSSGGIYHLAILDDEGNPQWDAVKQRFDEEWEAWKWTRFATIEEFVEANDKAGANPFYLEDPERSSIIEGPVRARIQMRSFPSYAPLTNPKPGVNGLVTYNLFAHLPYLDYTLDTTGSNAGDYPTLPIEFQNRDFAPGSFFSPYESLYLPGVGWVARVPDDLDDHYIQSTAYSASWYIEKLAPGESMSPAEPDADKLGFGLIFDDTGLGNITYSKISEYVGLMYYAAEFPVHMRYFPFDVSITNDAISYMSEQYELWSRPEPAITIKVTETTEIPIDYISVSKPDISSQALKVGETLSISNVTAFLSSGDEINDSIDSIHTYEIFNNQTNQVGLTGDLTWNSDASVWEAIDVDLSELTVNNSYAVRAIFTVENITGRSPGSVGFLYGTITPDTTPPVISSVSQEPRNTDPPIIRSTDSVLIKCLVSDKESGVANVTLSYHNGTWYNVTMVGFYEYNGTIPPQSPGKTIRYKITATDSKGNSNTTEEFNYLVALEYKQGQGLFPIIIIGGGLVIGIVIIGRFLSGMHGQKYDQV